MANLSQRLSQNVPGLYYVDASCLDCDLCRTLVPEVFVRHDETGYSFVHRQPTTADEIASVNEALDSCPCGSIGNDGAAAG